MHYLGLLDFPVRICDSSQHTLVLPNLSRSLERLLLLLFRLVGLWKKPLHVHSNVTEVQPSDRSWSVSLGQKAYIRICKEYPVCFLLPFPSWKLGVLLRASDNNLANYCSKKWRELNPTRFFLKCLEIGTGGAEICEYFVTRFQQEVLRPSCANFDRSCPGLVFVLL